jgi:hypothetical protein
MKSLLKATLAALTLAAMPIGSQAQTLIEKADKQYELHAYRLAAKSYESILARDPNEISAASRLANAYFQLNELENAAKWYARAMSDPALKAEAHLNYGKTLMMLGRYDAAEAQFQSYRSTDAVVADNYIKSCRFARNNEGIPSDLQITPLSIANTSASDLGVTMFGDNLIFSSSREDMKRVSNNTQRNEWSGAIANQLYQMPIEMVSNKASKISFLKSDLKNTFNESHPSYTADGKMVAFMKNNFDDGERIASTGGMEFSLFLANVDADGNWYDVKAFIYNGTGYSTGFPCLSSDGNTLYYVSNRPGGKGGFDLYMSQKRGSLWSEPRNMGNINTAGDEITPFADDKTLYFASDFHNGYGGYDIFKSENGEVVNMGPNVNSSSDDFGFVYNPTMKTGFFISTRKGGKGKEDIYKVARYTESANIVVLESGVMKPLKDVQVAVTQGNAQRLSQLKGGNYILDLEGNQSYTIEVKKEGFKSKSLKIEPNYSKTTRLVEVILEKDIPTQMSTIPQYSGIVLDGSTGKPLEGVIVRATNQNTNAQSEILTEKDGKYKFPLIASASYLMTYSKEGFVIGKKNVKQSDVRSKGFGEIILQPSALTGKETLTTDTGKNNTEVAGRGPSVLGSAGDIPPDYNKRPQTVTVKTSEVPFYAVQLMVSMNDDVLNLSKYDNLKEKGNIYIAPDAGKQKVRLGVFATKEEANKVLKNAAELGYKGIYIVEERNMQAITNNKYSAPKPVPMPKKIEDKTLPQPIKVNEKKEEKKLPQPTKTQPSKTATTTPKGENLPKPMSTVVKPKVATTEVKPTLVEDKTFKVQIASMKKPEWFDDSKVSAYWKIEQVKQGDLTLFVMDGIKTLQQAKDLKKKVQSSGYKDAKVVVREGDKYKVVD